MNVVITGATGFLGGALTKFLALEKELQTHSKESATILERKFTCPFQIGSIKALGRNEKKGAELTKLGVEFIRIDLTHKNEVIETLKNSDFVFHCAAKCNIWGNYQDFYNDNVKATQNIIEACLEHKVKRLIHVSSPSIYVTYQDKFNIKESDPLPTHQTCYYSQTKLLAEHRIDEAFKRCNLPVITIRPRGIFGPGDTTIFPRVLSRLQKGKLIVIGDGRTVCDFSYIDNVISSLLLAAVAPEKYLGNKYNITNDEPVLLWELIKTICVKLNLKFPKIRLSYNLVWYIAYFIECIWSLLRLNSEPSLTLYSATVIAKSLTLDISRAKEDLHYQPFVSMEEGVDNFFNWYKINYN